VAPKENIVTRLEVKDGKIDEPEDVVDPDKTPELVVVFARDERTSLAARAPGRHNGDLGNGPRINGTKISNAVCLEKTILASAVDNTGRKVRYLLGVCIFV
jgi:hypothetical protein